MENELPYEEILALRKNSAAESIHKIPPAEIEEFVHTFFANDVNHPWYQLCTDFVKEHADDTPYRGETEDGYGFIFYPKAEKGIWFCTRDRARGIGMLAPKAIQVLSEMVA